MKYCYACKQDVPIENFGKDRSKKDGLSDECKECKHERDKRYRARNRGACCKRLREWRNRNVEACRKTRKVYSHNEVGRENNNRASRKHRKKYPKEIKAHNKLNNAVSCGSIVKPNSCSSCSRRGLVEAHHSDYSKPLDVEWLCQKCHRKLHREK